MSLSMCSTDIGCPMAERCHRSAQSGTIPKGERQSWEQFMWFELRVPREWYHCDGFEDARLHLREETLYDRAYRDEPREVA